MAPKKRSTRKKQAGPTKEDAGLMSFLETTLAHLELLSGGQDDESQAMLAQLKMALGAGATSSNTEEQQELELTEAGMEALLNNIDAQMTQLEAALSNADDTTMQFLSSSLGAWGQGGSSAAQEEEAVGPGTGPASEVIEEGDEEGCCEAVTTATTAGTAAGSTGSTGSTQQQPESQLSTTSKSKQDSAGASDQADTAGEHDEASGGGDIFASIAAQMTTASGH